MSRRTATLLVVVELDDVPGTMHTKQSAKEIVRNVLWQRMPNYNPVVFHASVVTPNNTEGNIEA